MLSDPYLSKMKRWNNLPLAQKITWMVIGLSTLAMIAFVSVFLVIQDRSLKTRVNQSMTALAKSVAYNSASALTFGDRDSAVKTLNSLRTASEVIAARIVDQTGLTFASYSALRTPELPAMDTLSVNAPIEVDGEQLGQLELTFSLEQVQLILRQTLLWAVAFAVVSVVLVGWLSRWSALLLVRPLARLAALANRVGQTNDYSLRVTVAGEQDEASQLGTRFNDMLAQVEQRDRDLAVHRADLERQIEVRTADLLHARDVAETANRAKSVFLANMSHELRTPLNAVIGFSRLMAKPGVGSLSNEQRRNLEIINRSGNHLLTLINDVLELSKVEAGRVQVIDEDTVLDDLFADVTDMLGSRAAQAGLEFEVEILNIPAVVRVDAIKLRQILINLLGNAIKFTLKGKVKLSVKGRRNNSVMQPGDTQSAVANSWQLGFAVSDSGIGIAPEDHKKIFEPFTQMVTHATTAGTGLGLTISREYLHMLGGELMLDSTPGVGSTFSFVLTLPESDVQPESKRAAGAVVGLRPADRGKRILVVEDRLESRLLLCQLLEPLGFTLATAEDGFAAIDQVAAFRPDLVLMDWNMPRLDGLEATRRIRALERDSRTLVVMVTASAFEEQRSEAIAAGADDFMRKPVDEGELYVILERQLGVRFLREELVETADAVSDVTVSRADIAQLDVGLKAALRAAAEEMNQGKLTAVLTLIAAQSPALATGIEQMTTSFRFRELCELLDAEVGNG